MSTFSTGILAKNGQIVESLRKNIKNANMLLLFHWAGGGWHQHGKHNICTEAKFLVPEGGTKLTWHRGPHSTCVRVDIRWGYSKLRHKVQHAMFLLEYCLHGHAISASFFYTYIIWRVRVWLPLLCLCRLFMIFEECLHGFVDLNPECWVCWRASGRATNLATPPLLWLSYLSPAASWRASDRIL